MHATEDPTGDGWRLRVRMRGSIEQYRHDLERLIDEDADPYETSVYEALSDPQTRMIDQAQRSYEGQYRRRLRRRAAAVVDHQA